MSRSSFRIKHGKFKVSKSKKTLDTNVTDITVLLSLSLWYSHSAKAKIFTSNLLLFNLNKHSSISSSDLGESRRYVLHISTITFWGVVDTHWNWSCGSRGYFILQHSSQGVNNGMGHICTRCDVRDRDCAISA